jgi:hypothetical protein
LATPSAYAAHGRGALSCVLCARLAQGEELLGNEAAAVLADAPARGGIQRLMVVPRRHVDLLVALSSEEACSLYGLVDELRSAPGYESRPLAYDMTALEGSGTDGSCGHACVELRARFHTQTR